MRDHERDQWRHGEELIFHEKSFEGIPYLAAIKVSSPFYIQFLIQTRSLPRTPFTRKSNCYISGWSIEDKIETFLLNFADFDFEIRSLVLKYDEAVPMEKIYCDKFYKNYSIQWTDEIICLTDVIRNQDYAECIVSCKGGRGQK